MGTGRPALSARPPGARGCTAVSGLHLVVAHDGACPTAVARSLRDSWRCSEAWHYGAHMEMAKLALLGTSHVARPVGDRTGEGCTGESRYGPHPFGDSGEGGGGGAVHGGGWRRLRPLMCRGLRRRLQRAVPKPCGRRSSAGASPGGWGSQEPTPSVRCAFGRVKPERVRVTGSPWPGAGGSRRAPSELQGQPVPLQQDTRLPRFLGLPRARIPPRHLESAAPDHL